MKVQYIFYFLALLVGVSVFFTTGFEQLFAAGFAAAFVLVGFIASILLYGPPDKPTGSSGGNTSRKPSDTD